MRKGLLLLILTIAGMSACVKPKIYKAEVRTRELGEARESVFVKELQDRKAETAKLIDMVGALNRTIGNQETMLADLRTELSSRTQQMGESSSKLISEKIALEKELAATKAQLDNRIAIVQKVRSAQTERKLQLDNLKNNLTKVFEKSEGVAIAMEGETVVVNFNDKYLFDLAGINVNTNGKSLLSNLAGYLSNHPDIDVDIVAFTDNALPKDNKVLKDTWEWSLLRATTLVRLLIRDYNINANQMTPVGKGEFYPITSNETPEGRQRNRRTLVVFRPELLKVPTAE
jgi:chemotaxis protein MotB